MVEGKIRSEWKDYHKLTFQTKLLLRRAQSGVIQLNSDRFVHRHEGDSLLAGFAAIR